MYATHRLSPMKPSISTFLHPFCLVDTPFLFYRPPSLSFSFGRSVFLRNFALSQGERQDIRNTPYVRYRVTYLLALPMTVSTERKGNEVINTMSGI